MRFELMTSSLPRRRSTPELRGRSQRKLLACGQNSRAKNLIHKRQTNSLSYLNLERATRFELATLSLEG